jgi:hypothetical protein
LLNVLLQIANKLGIKKKLILQGLEPTHLGGCPAHSQLLNKYRTKLKNVTSLELIYYHLEVKNKMTSAFQRKDSKEQQQNLLHAVNHLGEMK